MAACENIKHFQFGAVCKWQSSEIHNLPFPCMQGFLVKITHFLALCLLWRCMSRTYTCKCSHRRSRYYASYCLNFQLIDPLSYIGRLWRFLLVKSNFWGLVLYSWKKKTTKRTAKLAFSTRWEGRFLAFKSYYVHSHGCPCTSIFCPMHSGATFSMRLCVVLQLCWSKLHISNLRLKCWTFFCLLDCPSRTCLFMQNYLSPYSSCALSVGQEVCGKGYKLWLL